MPNSKKQAGTGEQSDTRFVSLEDPRDGGNHAASPANDCRPGECQIADHGEKWAGMTNYTCKRCGYATVDEATARARNPAAFAKK